MKPLCAGCNELISISLFCLNIITSPICDLYRSSNHSYPARGEDQEARFVAGMMGALRALFGWAVIHER
jgi:hypothetical protein